jgi:hypothetical protein
MEIFILLVPILHKMLLITLPFLANLIIVLTLGNAFTWTILTITALILLEKVMELSSCGSWSMEVSRLVSHSTTSLADPDGKHKGMNGGHIVMAIPGGNYSAVTGLNLDVEPSVGSYVIDSDGSAFRHWVDTK